MSNADQKPWTDAEVGAATATTTAAAIAARCGSGRACGRSRAAGDHALSVLEVALAKHDLAEHAGAGAS